MKKLLFSTAVLTMVLGCHRQHQSLAASYDPEPAPAAPKKCINNAYYNQYWQGAEYQLGPLSSSRNFYERGIPLYQPNPSLGYLSYPHSWRQNSIDACQANTPTAY